MTPPERLGLLMPWVNGDRLSIQAVKTALHGFLHDFNVAGLRLQRDAGRWETHDATEGELAATRRKLVKLFEIGFWFTEDDPNAIYQKQWAPDGLDWNDLRLPLSLPSLRFAIGRLPLAGKRSRLSRAERTALVQRGSYELRVEAGRLRDLVTFLVMHLLSVPGEISVSRCPAPAPGEWKKRCNRLFVWSGKGRPKECCSEECTTRRNDLRKEQQRKEDMKRSKR